MAELTSEEILAQLVSFDTTSRNSNLALIDWVEDYLANHGVASERVYDDTGQKANLYATIGPSDVPGYILSGHTDVVPVDGQSWQTDPFKLEAADGRLYGRGTCDMKGFLACCLAKVPDFVAAPLAKPIHLAFSYDEEVGCIGIQGLLNELKERPVIPEACFVGEPTNMQVVIAHKAKRSLRAFFTGKACHSSLSPQGVNAIDFAARFVVKLKEMADRLETGPIDALYDVPFTTAHTGTIEGGTILNIVPEHCVVSFEFRVLPNENADALVSEIMEFAKDTLEPEMKSRSENSGIKFEWISQFPGLNTAQDADVTRLAKRLAGRNDHAKVAYGTEAGLFVDIADVPTVVVGPGSIEQAHKPDEFIVRSELEKCGAFLDRLIFHAGQP
ncbi:MAG: acetylornithine deacetylase [Stappiaceae bacterium]